MAYINVDEVYILDNTGLQVDQTTDLPFKDAGLTESQQAQARKNIAAGGTNPNLIDNPWFTIRQRGAGPFSANGFTVDRWQIGGGPPTVTPQTPYGVSISATAGYNLLQNLPYTVAEYGGKTMTLSAIVDGELYAVTFVYAAGTVPYVTFNNNNDLIRYDCTNAQVRITHNIAATTHNFTVTAVKLELGSVSTLANDLPPDYGTELLKCQRYFVRIKTIGSYQYAPIGIGAYTNSTTIRMGIFTPVPMRAVPSTLSVSGTLYVRGGGSEYSVNNIGVIDATSNTVFANVVVSSAPAAHHTYTMLSATGSYIDISADL